jgi:1-acyl-sn-glycerol-3-phosphate acyltransferase
MPAFRKLYRTILLGLHLIIGIILTLIFLRNTRPPGSVASKVISIWLGLVVSIFNVKVKTYGTALQEKTLFVANHISWLDTVILGNLVPVHFLSKHEIKTMPLIGWLATRAGTLYIKRGCSFSSMEAGSEITASLKQHHNSIVFAEGRTTYGDVKKFHSRLIQSAIDAHAMVQPVAIYYPRKNPETGETEINPDSLFVGKIGATESFHRIARAPGIDAEVHFLEPINSAGMKREEIARYAHDKVVKVIERIKSSSR